MIGRVGCSSDAVFATGRFEGHALLDFVLEGEVSRFVLGPTAVLPSFAIGGSAFGAGGEKGAGILAVGGPRLHLEFITQQP